MLREGSDGGSSCLTALGCALLVWAGSLSVVVLLVRSEFSCAVPQRVALTRSGWRDNIPGRICGGGRVSRLCGPFWAGADRPAALSAGRLGGRCGASRHGVCARRDRLRHQGRDVFNFASSSAEVPATMGAFLKSAADDIKQLPVGHVLEIAGYTDNTGNPEKNIALSQKRADAVRDTLIKDRVNPNMLATAGPIRSPRASISWQGTRAGLMSYPEPRGGN